MSTASTPATPQRPIPGGFTATPAPPPTIFAANAASLRQNTQPQAQTTSTAASAQTAPTTISPVERAAKTINDVLTQEARFPEMETYVTQGASADYELPSTPAWMPFQKLKQYDLPSKLLEQINHTGVGVNMGIFAGLGHAWLALDNCLYLWDYTLPNPDIIGWEENAYPIRKVNLAKPRPGVFVKEIDHVIVVTTTERMILLGVSTTISPMGVISISLYNTQMSISVSSIQVEAVASSDFTGRIFFSGLQDDSIYEFRYQQEEGWFSSKTSKKFHAASKQGTNILQGMGNKVSSFTSTRGQKTLIQELHVDDSRNLLIALSNKGDISIYALREELTHAITRHKSALLQNVGHFVPKTELLDATKVRFVGLEIVPRQQANKISLIAITNTGVRLYMSVTSNYYNAGDSQHPPTSMMILHARFPPKDPRTPPAATSPNYNTNNNPNSNSNVNANANSNTSTALQVGYSSPTASVDSSSVCFSRVDYGLRIAPSTFVFDLGDASRNNRNQLFCVAQDSGRLKNPQDPTQLNQRFSEFGMFIDLPGSAVVVDALTSQSGATKTPLGYGNELAEQFDKESQEFAVVTSTAIVTIRRRRLVDVFAAVMRYSSPDDEGREGDVKRFIRLYGRSETAATALAVACGQGKDVTSDSRLNSVTDPQAVEGARRVFIEHGGKPETNTNALTDNSASQLDNVRPSPRHEGMALYISRLVRDIWSAYVIREVNEPGVGPKLVPNVQISRLKSIQEALNALSDFLDRNKAFIDGLSGPQAASRLTSRQDEIAMQGEQRAMQSLVDLVSSVVEGISFILVLFDEPVHDIINALSEDSRKRIRGLAFEDLFITSAGRDLAKELVKAIVNRNIANGSNVDTVADALRRRCGSFCSADDVIIFKAQEQVKRASEAGGQSETGRVLLNESQRLFQKVAASLSMEHLLWATEQYVHMAFYAGAIQLCLVVANERDRGRQAQGWLKDGMPEGDSRKEYFDARKKCYDLIFDTLQKLDNTNNGSLDTADGSYSLAAKRRNEAHDVIHTSEDMVFQACLYDWYISIGQADRLLEIDSQNVINYLKRKSQEDRDHADLLWRYYAHYNDYLQAASVQLDLAQGYFDLSLEERIEYLSRARTNASTRQTALMDSRQSKQQLLREISDLLDVANIQDDVLQRMKTEPRLTGERRSTVLESLSNRILSIDELFNQYADQASYYDIMLLIYQVADHRNPVDIKSAWQGLINQIDDRALAHDGQQALPWESVGEKVRELGSRLNTSDSVFPIQTLLPMLERYFMEPREHTPPRTWVPDLFLSLDIPHETLLPVMEQMYYGNEAPFTGGKRKTLAGQMLYILQSWFADSERKGDRFVFGSEENASLVVDVLSSLIRGAELDATARKGAEDLLAMVQRGLR